MVAERKVKNFHITNGCHSTETKVLGSRFLPWQHNCLIRFLRARNITIFLERERSKVKKKTFLFVEYDTFLITFLVYIRRFGISAILCYETNNSVVHVSLDPSYSTHYLLINVKQNCSILDRV